MYIECYHPHSVKGDHGVTPGLEMMCYSRSVSDLVMTCYMVAFSCEPKIYQIYPEISWVEGWKFILLERLEKRAGLR